MAKVNNGCLIPLPSETYAFSAEKLLKLKGIRCSAIKNTDTKKGCTYALSLDCRDLDRARQILLFHSIPIS